MAKRKALNVALIGQGFMGRTHSNAWSQVRKFFTPKLEPVMHTVFGQPEEKPRTFARRWGWKNTSTDWKALVKSDDIDLVDVVTPNFMHAPVAIAALEAGKNVSCEKPIAHTLKQAREMAQLAKKKRAKTFVWYNYRRCPAVAMAYKIVKAGKLGTIRHVRGFYLQDWAGPDVPLLWRFDKNKAGSGSLGDLAAHVVDMTRFITGQEITRIDGAVLDTFIKQRTLMEGVAAGGIAAGQKAAKGKGKVTVDDAALFLCHFAGGAVGNFEATRFATGRQNQNGCEINGEKGSIRFDFERMNELKYYDATAERNVQGWTTIMCTHGGDHPYAEAWWPDGHVLGYEHSFVNQASDIINVLAGGKPVVPLPDFNDAYQTQRVLEAVVLSARNRCPVKLSQVK